MRHTRADSAVLVSAKGINSEVRAVGDSLDVRVMSAREVDNLEQEYELRDVDFGSFSADLDTLWDELRADAKSETVLDRAWKFLRADVWHQEPWLAVKRSIALLERTSKHWPDTATEDRQRLIRLLLVEGTIVFSWASIQVAGLLRWLPEDEAEGLLRQRLSEGVVGYREMTELSKQFDSVVGRLLDHLKAPRSVIVDSMGMFSPQAPPWANGFAELVTRLARESQAARELPRVLDVALYESIVRQRPTQKEALRALRVRDLDATIRLGRFVGKFLESHAGVPSDVFTSLSLATTNGTGSIAERDADSSQGPANSGTELALDLDGTESSAPHGHLQAADSGDEEEGDRGE